MKLFLSLLFTTLLVVPTNAAGPKKIAKSDRSLWPYKVNSIEEFDFASKMEMLVFVSVFNSYDEVTTEDLIKKKLDLEKTISMPSITTWKENTRKIIIANSMMLGKKLPHEFVVMKKQLPLDNWEQITIVSDAMKQSVPENLKAWLANATDFYDGYVYEQMRLAAIFTSTTSEILTLQPSEVTGADYKDKQFLLTFDDGPTPTGGNTDKLIATLSSQRINGLFFVTGDMLSARLKANSIQKMRVLYDLMAVGSHGKVHKPHPKYEGWKSSILFTDHLIDSIANVARPIKFFRPPYGQRNDEMINFLKDKNTRVMLWNIDSQDWNATITAPEVADRVTTLMLLWRRGIILFHDIHPKANTALPAIWEGIKNSGVMWVDAKGLK